jgi:hypothetical protein
MADGLVWDLCQVKRLLWLKTKRDEGRRRRGEDGDRFFLSVSVAVAVFVVP